MLILDAAILFDSVELFFKRGSMYSLPWAAYLNIGAKTIDRWAVTLKQIHPLIFDETVVPQLRSHKIHSTLWVGRSRVGKSSITKTIGHTISAYEIGEAGRDDLTPSVITTKKLDFLRLVPGSIYKPAVMDDIVLHLVTVFLTLLCWSPVGLACLFEGTRDLPCLMHA